MTSFPTSPYRSPTHSSSTQQAPNVCCPTCGKADSNDGADSRPETTYRRCQSCGEVWNSTRQVSPRIRPQQRW
jgi:hypothetical protein